MTEPSATVATQNRVSPKGSYAIAGDSPLVAVSSAVKA